MILINTRYRSLHIPDQSPKTNTENHKRGNSFFQNKSLKALLVRAKSKASNGPPSNEVQNMKVNIERRSLLHTSKRKDRLSVTTHSKLWPHNCNQKLDYSNKGIVPIMIRKSLTKRK